MIDEEGGAVDLNIRIERRETHSVKWDRYRHTPIIPLWIADMDFAAPSSVIDALHERVAHGIFGYGNPPERLLPTIVAYLRSRYDWAINPEWVVWLPGLVTGLNLACRAVGQEGDTVATWTPIYPPFLSAPLYARRRLIRVPLIRNNQGQYHFCVADLERSITPDTRLLLLCNPHNPVSRTYSREELELLGDFCIQRGLTVCSDEIHADLILDKDKRHRPFATIRSALEAQTITLMAPSKTFNIPGLGFSFAVIADSALRNNFRSHMKGIIPEVNVMGYVAALAAYEYGRSWLDHVLDYLRGNRDVLEARMAVMRPLVLSPIEATYLAWIDARALGVADPQRFFEKAGVGLSDGADFGAPGFVRLNFGCQRELLEEALDRMAKAVDLLIRQHA